MSFLMMVSKRHRRLRTMFKISILEDALVFPPLMRVRWRFAVRLR